MLTNELYVNVTKLYLLYLWIIQHLSWEFVTILHFCEQVAKLYTFVLTFVQSHVNISMLTSYAPQVVRFRGWPSRLLFQKIPFLYKSPPRFVMRSILTLRKFPKNAFARFSTLLGTPLSSNNQLTSCGPH